MLFVEIIYLLISIPSFKKNTSGNFMLKKGLNKGFLKGKDELFWDLTISGLDRPNNGWG